MARYKISGRALGAARRGGIAQGFMQSRINRETAELEREKLEVTRLAEENRSKQLAASIASQAETQNLAERELILKNNQPNSAGFLGAEVNENGKLVMTSDIMLIPKHDNNKSDVYNAASTLNFFKNQANNKEFLYALQNNKPEIVESMFSNAYTTATAPITAEVDGVNGLTSKEAMFINTGDNSAYANLFKVYPKFKEIVEARNIELGKFLPTDDNGDMTFIENKYTNNGQDFTLHKFINPANTTIELNKEQLENINRVSKKDIFEAINSDVHKSSSSFLSMLKDFGNLSGKGDKHVKLNGAAIYLSDNTQQFYNFKNLSSQLATLPSDQLEKIIRGTFDPRKSKRDAADGVYSVEDQMSMVDKVIFSHALLEYGGDLTESINQGNNVFKTSLKENFFNSRLQPNQLADNDNAYKNAKGFVKNSTDLLENQKKIRVLSKDVFGDNRENIATLGQAVSGSIFDVALKVKGFFEATGFIDRNKYFENALGFEGGNADILIDKGVNNGQNIQDTLNEISDGNKFEDILGRSNQILAKDDPNITSAFKNNVKEVMELYTRNQRDNLEAYRDGAITKEIYLLRAESESLKVRMAFQAASMVQGGGAGGGRTISNNDYEAIYKSLFSAGTGEAFDRVIMLARQEMGKAMMRAKINSEYGSVGIQRELGDISDRLMDESFKIALKQRDPLSVSINYNDTMSAEEKIAGLTGDRPEELGDLLVNSPEDLNILGIDQTEIKNIVSDQTTNKEQKAASIGDIYINNLLPQVYKRAVGDKGITKMEDIKAEMFKTLTAASGNYEINGEIQFVSGISLRPSFANALIEQFDFTNAQNTFLQGLNMQTEELIGQNLGR